MPVNLASPGIIVKEVDLTIGRVDTATNKNAAIVGPFQRGPVNQPVLVENEQDLLDNFGEPSATNDQFETWMVASSYLSYGGQLSVVRAGDESLCNAKVGSATSITINSLEDYTNNGYDENTITNITVAARDPGSWGNGVKVAIVDSGSDQILTVGTAHTAKVGYGVTMDASGVRIGAGGTDALDGFFKGIVTENDISGQISVKLTHHVTAAGIQSAVEYQPSGTYAFPGTGTLSLHQVGGGVGKIGAESVSAQKDWYNEQTIGLTNSTLSWSAFGDRPGTSQYADARSSRFDEVHVMVIDDEGTVTGNAGTILEKHLNLSKAKDGEFSAGSSSNWRKFIANNSRQIFAGGSPSGITTTNIVAGTGSTTFFNSHASDNGWDQNAQGISFAGIGATTLTLAGGQNYDSGSDVNAAGALDVPLSGRVAGYELFENTEEFDVDFILMGSGGMSKEDTQALASEIISVAEIRQDSIAFVSPNRGSLIVDTVGSAAVSPSATITENLKSFYSPIPSSSYAVFDSGYKYMYDRFADTFRYVPLNGDIAGCCARNDINNYPWFSPAGTSRGAILNAVKLAYNPSQTQRDKLYADRINPVIFSPGSGIILFGDKTGYGKASAFDRINVRRLFIYLEDAISAAARDQLFEFNDEITRTNFVNIVEPFLRDVQSKRGITDFRVVCDETNNTAAVIDNNEFVADVFIKPNRSINFIGLTFVATRTGVSFDEVIGTV
jgi:hypothetical protein